MPLSLLADQKVIFVSCRNDHTAIITKEKKLYTFGDNRFGQLGLGDANNRSIPTLVTVLEDQKVIAVSCGGVHTAIITKNHQLYTFGSNLAGQLGLGDLGEEQKTSPTLVTALKNQK